MNQETNQSKSSDDFLSIAKVAFEELQKSVDELENSTHIYVCKPMKKDNFKGWRRLNTHPDDRIKFGDTITSKIKDLMDRDLVELDYDGLDGETTLGIISKEDLAQITEFDPTLPNFTDDDYFAEDSAFLNRVKFTASQHSFTNNSEIRLSIFYNVGGGLIATPKNFFFGIKHPDNKFKVISDDVIQIPTVPVFFEYKGIVFIDSEKQFSQLTKFDEAVNQKAIEAIEKLETIDFLDFADKDKILRIVNSGGREFSRRLASAYSSGAFDRMKKENIIEAVKNYEIDVIIDVQDDKIVLDIDDQSRKAKNDLIFILSDRCAQSLITGDAHYITKGRPLARRPAKTAPTPAL